MEQAENDEEYVSPLIGLGMAYAASYTRNGRAFINCFKKSAVVRDACSMVVLEYRKELIDMEDKEVDFTEYAKKHAAGKDIKTLADILYIIYQLTKK